MKVGYLDCISGISGDMILGALVDCGLPFERLNSELSKLPLKGYSLSAQPEQRGVITGTRITLSLDTHEPEHRSLSDILNLIQRSRISERAKALSSRIFERLAEAEAKVHRIPIEEVHFHEVGATDAVLDIVGAVVGLEILNVESLLASPLPSGGGTVHSQHGNMNSPAPATLELIASSGAPIRPTPEREVELVTPTGAAIVTTLASFERPTMFLHTVGYGVGARDTGAIPNVLPLWLGERVAQEPELLLLETNIDDMSPELYGYVMELLFETGALDVWFTPIQMKKNRPALTLSVLAQPEHESEIVKTLLQETSTFGLRVQRVGRHQAERELIQFDSRIGTVGVKIKRFQGEIAGLYPEYEDCRRIAQKRRMPLHEVYRIVSTEAGAELSGGDRDEQ